MKKRISFMTIGVVLALSMLFTPGVLQAQTFSPLVPPTPPGTYKLADFLILVDNQLILKGPANVNCCQGESLPIPERSDLGSRGTILLGGVATTNVPVGAPTIKDVAVIAPTVTLNKFAKVSQTITQSAASLIKSGSGIVGPSVATVDPNLPTDLPAFPPFPSTIVVGTNDIVVPAGGSVTITPTVATFTSPPSTVNAPFRDLIIGANATVTFAPGASTQPFQFRRIIANTPSKYQLVMQSPNITIDVSEFVRLAEFGQINPTNQNGLVINVAGLDGSYGGANKNQKGVVRPAPAGSAPAAFEYDGDGTINACFVFVKNGTANLRGITLYATQWFGDSLQEISNLTITLQNPGEPPCFPVTTPCPCCDQCP